MTEQERRNRAPSGDSQRRRRRHGGLCPTGTSAPHSVHSHTTYSSPILALFDAAGRRDTRASAPSRTTGAGGWPPICSALLRDGPAIAAATGGSSSPRPPTRRDGSIAEWASSRTSATPRRFASPRSEPLSWLGKDRSTGTPGQHIALPSCSGRASGHSRAALQAIATDRTALPERPRRPPCIHRGVLPMCLNDLHR